MSQAATGFDPLQWVNSRLFGGNTDAKNLAAQKQFNAALQQSPFLKAATNSLLKQIATSPDETTQQLLKAGVAADQLKRITQGTELEGLRQQMGLVNSLNQGRSQIRINEANVNADNTIRTGKASTDNLLRVLDDQQGQEQWMANLDQGEGAAYRDHDLQKTKMLLDAQRGNSWIGALGQLGMGLISAFV